MSNRRATALILVATLLLFIANITVWVWTTVIDSDGFTEVAYSATTGEEVRQAIATIIIDEILEGTPIIRSVLGDQLIAALSGILGSEPFHLTFDRIVSTVHRALIAGETQPVVIDVSTISLIVNALIVALQSDATEEPPRQFPSEIVLVEGRDFPTIRRIVNAIPWLATFSTIATLTVAGWAILKSVDRRRTITAAGFATLGVALLTLAILLPLRTMVVNTVVIREQRTIVGGLYDGILASLRAQSIGLAAVGALLLVVTAMLNQQGMLHTRQPEPGTFAAKER